MFPLNIWVVFVFMVTAFYDHLRTTDRSDAHALLLGRHTYRSRKQNLSRADLLDW